MTFRFLTSRVFARTGRVFTASLTALMVWLTAQTSVLADVRIVSVKTDTDGITVTQVSVQGEQLKEAGRSADSVFVEAGKAGTEFACDQTVEISLSDGRSLTRNYDLCALNYALTVATADATRPQTRGPRIQRKLVMIRTDDDTAIREVFVDEVAMQVRRRSNARVFVEMEGDPDADGRIACRRNLRLVLADGRILKDEVDICGDWKVTVATKDTAAPATRPVRQAVPSTVGPNAPPLSGGVRRPTDGQDGQAGLRGSTAAAPQTGGDTRAPSGPAEQPQTQMTLATPAAPGADEDGLPTFENRTWFVAPGGTQEISLIYGTRESDDRGFLASCARGSDEIVITLVDTVEDLKEGDPLTVTLAAREVLKSYEAIGSSAETEAGVSMPVLRLSADDPIWTALIRGNDLAVALDGTWRYRVSLTGSAAPVRQFRATCARPAPEPQIIAGPAPDGSEITVYANRPQAASCNQEGAINAVPSAEPATMIFRNDRRRPVLVHWIDFDGIRQLQAQVPPGGEMIQPTVAGHPWLVSNMSGRCLGIYYPQGRTRTVTLLPGRPLADAPPVYRPAPAPVAPLFGSVQDRLDLGYDCNDGTYLSVTIDNARRVAVVRESGLAPITLSDRSNGPDFYYINGGHELVGSGARVTWARPGAPPRSCRIL